MTSKVDYQNGEHTEFDVVNEKAEAQGDVQHVNAASVALAAAVAARKPNLLSKNMIQLYCIMSVGYLVSTMNGFDSSLMGAINAMKPFQNSFGLTGEGQSISIICYSSKTSESTIVNP
jgi:hypothetical protein